ncbi:uncharacterized protein LOC127101718 [Lathyrus oleraceus]|uniref:uncharacterized protein LOC127101718 n=1 Tax=Pisum sativum TaxID=3888 RepID=UPI0021D1B7D6|nr:uncharacterized protein LOC127101718 [Pisum sativum]
MNIPKECDNKRSKEFKKVYVSGKCMEFSPEIINRFMGKSEEEQAEVEVKEWLRKGKLSAGLLSVKYAVLHRIGATNWVPTNHTFNIAIGLGKFIYIVGIKTKFDFRSYVFDQTMKNMPITFPSFIYCVILSQHPGILISSNVACKRESPLSLHYRLFTGKHAPDIVMTFGKETDSSISKDGMIVELEDTCKALDETIKTCTKNKIRLESLIKALTKEGIYGNMDGYVEEEENEEDENVDTNAIIGEEIDVSSDI